MKKIMAIILVLSFVLAGCGYGVDSVPDTNPMYSPAPEGDIAQPHADNKVPEPAYDTGYGATGLSFAESYDEIYEELQRRQEAMDYTYRDYINLVPVEDSAEAVPEAPAGDESAEYSGTNVQVEGIDEGDIVKTDGKYIYVLRQNSVLIILEASRADSKIISSMELGHHSEGVTGGYSYKNVHPQQLFICGDILAVIGENYSYAEIPDGVSWSYSRSYSSYVELYDVSDPIEPKLLNTLGQDGSILATRLVGEKLYIVSRWNDYELMRGEDCIPHVYRDEGVMPIPAGDIAICPGTDRSYIVAAVYDIATGESIAARSVLGGGNNVYMSANAIYVAGSYFSDGASQPRSEDVYTVTDYFTSTDTRIFRFDISGGGLEFGGEALVPGYISNQFSMDEYDGCLRLVTTRDRSEYTMYRDEERGFENRVYGNTHPRTNGLYILDEELNIVGSVEDLAPGESIYSARFDGDMAYFCTFEQVDPLFAVDVSDPAEPKVLSALKISGFSEYLHFWDEDRLFGLGYEADPETGVTDGLKMVMFDVSDKANVIVENALPLENCWYSEALHNHHAAFIQPEKNLIGFVGEGDYYLFGYDAESGFFQRGYVSFDHWDYNIRGMYIGNCIYLVGQEGCSVLDLENCRVLGYIAW